MPKDSFELRATIDATGMQVLFAFLDVQAIKTWWKAKNAVVQPRPGGVFAVEWEAAKDVQDDLLGPQGGVLTGVLDKSMAGHFVHFGALHWLTPRGETFGPTRLEVDVFSKGDPRRKPATVRLRRSAFQAGPRWERYFDLEKRAWEKTLADLAAWCASQAPQDAEAHVTALGGPYLAEAVLRDRPIS